MTKEHFLYELVDSYLYPLSQGAIAIENYCQIDKTGEYIMAADVLEECFDLYDSIGASDCSEEEIDTILNIFMLDWLPVYESECCQSGI